MLRVRLQRVLGRADQEIGPGKAFQGILVVIVPDSATGLVCHFTPIEYMSEDLTFQVNLGE